MRSWRDWSWADGNFWDSGVQPQAGVATNFTILAEALSATRVTVAVAAPAAALALTDAAPAVVPLRLIVAFPEASVVLDAPDSIPLLVVQATETPAGTGLPWASCTVATSTLLSASLAVMVVGVATRLTTLAVALSATRVTVAVCEPTAAVALTAAEPATVPFKVMLALPEASVVLVAPDSVPLLVVQATEAPAVTAFP